MATRALRRRSLLLGMALLVAVFVQPTAVRTTATPTVRHPAPAAVAPVVETIGSTGSIGALAAAEGDLAYIGEAAALNIVDLHDLAHPVRLGQALLPATVTSLDLAGDLLYVGTRTGLHILNVSDPAHPVRVGDLALPNVARVQVVGTRVYLSLFTPLDELYVIDASDPTYPRIAGQYTTSNAINDWYVVGTLAYLATGKLMLVDLADPAQPVVRGSYSESVYNVFAVGTIAYATQTYTDGLHLVILDTSAPAQPEVLGSTVITGSVEAIRVFGNRAYMLIGTDSGKLLEAVGVGNPAQIAVCGSSPLDTYPTNGATIRVSGARAYVTHSSETQVLNVSSCGPPQVLGSYKSVLESSQDLMVSGTFAYAIAGNGFDLVHPSRFVVIDVSDPANPTLRGSYPNAQHSWVTGGFAYIIENQHAFSILDLSNPDLPTRRGTLNLPVLSASSNVGAPIRVFNGIAYIAEQYVPPGTTIAETDPSLYRLHLVDVHDPDHPVYLGTMLDNVMSIKDIAAVGTLIYVAAITSTVDNLGNTISYTRSIIIIDASTPAQPVVRGTYADTIDTLSIAVQGTRVYLSGHNGLAILDVQDALHPVQIGYYSQPLLVSNGQTVPATVLETRVDGRWAYVYMNGSRDIVDVANPAAPLLRLRYPSSGSMQLLNGLQYFGNFDGITIRRVDPAQLPSLVWLPIAGRQA